MHFFITGHTGFKGSWLILLLKELGHDVSGYALKPAKGGLFELGELEKKLTHHFVGDVRNLGTLRSALETSEPDFAIHMAAQPVVLGSYLNPIETYTTNVDGTRNFLVALSDLRTPPVSLVITTDKVYRDDGKGSYVESDPLGGHDPYSASKAMADLLTQSWATNNPDLKINIARAGNVIGAFDVSQNRLVPDIINAINQKKELQVRQPMAVRPWQHVLDCLSGYLSLLKASSCGTDLPLALNFGPDPSSIRTVIEVVTTAQRAEPELSFSINHSHSQPKETLLLTLDSSKARELLHWKNQIGFELAVEMSLAGLRAKSPIEISLTQIRSFLQNKSTN